MALDTWIKSKVSKIPEGENWCDWDFIRELLNELLKDRARLFQGSGDEIPRSDGRYFKLKATDKQDLQLYAADAGKIGVRFGNVTPAIARASGVNVWPDVFSATSDPPWTYTFTPSGTGVAYLQVTVDPGSSTTAPKVTNITISGGASLPTNTDTVGYFPLGNFTITDGVARVLNSEGIGSQGYLFCGRDHYFYRA